MTRAGILRPFVFLIAWVVCVPASAVEPFKEPLLKEALKQQPVVYARADDRGVGVQILDEVDYKDFLQTAAAAAGGPAGLAISYLWNPPNVLEILHAVDASEQLSPAFDHEKAQRELEEVLKRSLPGSGLFASSPIIKTLAPGERVTVRDFDDDPVLVIETGVSLLRDYRALQVTAYAYVLSGAHAAATPMSPTSGRLYLNRFVYISDRLPEPIQMTEEQIQVERDAIMAKYPKKKLTKAQSEARTMELRALKNKNSAEERRNQLLAQWLANDGLKLHEARRSASESIAELIIADINESRAALVASRGDDKAPLIVTDMGSRKVVRYKHAPYAGTLASLPSEVLGVSCSGVVYDRHLRGHSAVPACAPQRLGSLCRPGYVPTIDGCKRILKKTKRQIPHRSESEPTENIE
jgi:hypothetical protein